MDCVFDYKKLTTCVWQKYHKQSKSKTKNNRFGIFFFLNRVDSLKTEKKGPNSEREKNDHRTKIGKSIETNGPPTNAKSSHVLIGDTT